MRVVWFAEVPKCPIEQKLACGGIEEVVAADDVGDALAEIVDDDGELVGGLPSLGPDDKVADRVERAVRLRSGKGVGEIDLDIGDGAAPAGGWSVEFAGESSGAEVGGESRFVRAFLRSGGSGFDVFAAEVGGVGVARRGKFLHGRDVGREIVGLDYWAAVPVDTEPRQSLHARFRGIGLNPWPIQIFNSQEDLPMCPAGKGPVDEECAGVSEVKGTGWGGCQACHMLCGFCLYLCHLGYHSPVISNRALTLSVNSYPMQVGGADMISAVAQKAGKGVG